MSPEDEKEDKPTEAPAQPPPATDFDFDELIVFAGSSSWEVDEEKIGVNEPSFDAFPPVEGERGFDLEQAHLLDLLAVTECAVRKDGSRPVGLVKLTISQSGLRARTFDGGAFSEIQVPLLGPARGLSEGQSIDLLVSFEALAATSKGIGSIGRFTIQSSQKRLVCTSERFERPLVLHSEDSFLDADEERIGVIDPALRQPVELRELRRALAYVAPAVHPDIQELTQLIEIRDGRMLGGTVAALAVVSSPKLAQNMRIRDRFIAPLMKILERLQEGNTGLFETSHYYVFQDQNMTFGFEKTSKTLSKLGELVDRVAERRAEADWHRIRIDRGLLTATIKALNAALSVTHRQARLQCGHAGANARCTFTASKPGVRVKVSHQALREDHGPNRNELFDKPIDFQIPPQELLTAAKGGDATFVDLDYYSALPLLMVVDEDGSFEARMLIGLPKAKSAKKKAVNQNEAAS